MQQPETAGVAQRTTPNGLYGGTKEEMVRLVNESGILEEEIEDLDGITFDQLVLAIHKIQQEMGITGTTAKEAAETISGSKASLSAAWQDLLSAVGGEGNQDRLNESMENFKESFSAYMENFIPTLVTTIGNSGDLVTAIADSVADLPKDLLSKIAEEGLDSGAQMVGGISKITGWIIDSITNMFKTAKADPTSVKNFGKAIGDFLGTAISDIVTNAPAIMEGIISVGVNLAGGLVEGLFKGLFGEGAEVDKITEQLQDDLTDIDVNNSKATALLRYMDSLYEKYGNGVKRMAEWKEAEKELEAALPGAGKTFEKFGSDIQGAIERLNTMNESMRRTAIISGITKALHAEYELLGEQTAKQAQAETQAEIAGVKQQGMRDRMMESLNAYAKEFLRQNEGNEFVDEAGLAAALGVQNGKIQIGNDLLNLSDLNFDQLNNLVHTLGNLIDVGPNGQNIWDESLTDSIVSPDELNEYAAEYAKLQAEIEAALKNAAEAQKQVEETNKQIAITEAASQKLVDENRAAFEAATKEVSSGGDSLAGALKDLADKIAGIRIVNGVTYMPKATGMDYVPFNGFRAELHKGETILPADEAKRYRAGMGGDGAAAIIGALQGMQQNMQNIRIVVGKKTFGQAVVDYGGDGMSDYIGDEGSRIMAGYGT